VLQPNNLPNKAEHEPNKVSEQGRTEQDSRSRTEQGERMTLLVSLTWQPVRNGGRTPLLVCSSCHARCVNSSNALRRAGWQEARTHRGLIFRCGDCAAAEAVEL
jgi:hypothetical protein